MKSRSPYKVCERVYQVGGPDLTDGNDCCVYLINGGGELALVDSGLGPSYKSILANIIVLGFLPEDIRFILLTHCHIDHVGGAAAFRSEYGVELVIHQEDSRPLEEGDRLMTGAFLYGARLEPMRIERKMAGDRMELGIGDTTLHVLHTPGHSPGSVSAYLDTRSRVLFGQDIHGPFHPDFGSDIGVWRESMRGLLALEADILCEGHFGVYSPRDAVRSYIEGYLERYQR